MMGRDGGGRHDAAVRDARAKMRQDELERSIKAQHFYDWRASLKEMNPGSRITTDPVWYVILTLHCSSLTHSLTSLHSLILHSLTSFTHLTHSSPPPSSSPSVTSSSARNEFMVYIQLADRIIT